MITGCHSKQMPGRKRRWRWRWRRRRNWTAPIAHPLLCAAAIKQRAGQHSVSTAMRESWGNGAKTLPLLLRPEKSDLRQNGGWGTYIVTLPSVSNFGKLQGQIKSTELSRPWSRSKHANQLAPSHPICTKPPVQASWTLTPAPSRSSHSKPLAARLTGLVSGYADDLLPPNSAPAMLNNHDYK